MEREEETLVARLARFPVDRYPVQHATTQFHLGSALLHAGEPGPALLALSAAHDLFQCSGMRLEQAKAAVMLGVALRTAGRLDEATATFAAAADVLHALDQPAEQAAAAYNLGLVRQDCGDLQGAHAAWSQAHTLFVSAGCTAQAAAAARDLGGSLLTTGEVAAAVRLLEQALALAEQAADEPGAGSAANALGLGRLAAEDPAAAVTVLRRALVAFPRSLRPVEHAMVKANLALAHEQAGDPARARLSAGQALAVPGAAAPVRAQARQLLSRLSGPGPEDLLAVLDAESRDQWVATLREEALRLADLPAEQRCAMLSGFLDGLLARPGHAYDLAESLLHVVLEMPPQTYELLVATVVDACADRSEEDGERVHAVIGSAMARFALPQWQRLAAGLNAAAKASGRPATWT